MAATLRELQRWLASLVLDPDGLDAHGLVEARRHLDHPDDATIVTRLDAYRQGYPARIEEALADTFVATRHLIGAGDFRALAGRYQSEVPAGGYDLAAVGQALPAFLVGDVLTDTLPFLPDLAQLEWAIHRAFHATLPTPVDAAATAPAALGDWGLATLAFQPGVGVVESLWPIRDLWLARKTPRDAIDIALADRPQCVLAYRSGLQVATEPITPAEARCLARLLAGSPLGEVLCGPDESAAAATIGQWTAGWARRGLVAAIRVEAAGAADEPGVHHPRPDV